MIFVSLQKWLTIWLSAVFLCLAVPALAVININLSGSSETSNAALETHKSQSVSANLSLSLGENFQLGLTHRRSFDNKIGLKRIDVAETKSIDYVPFEDNGESITNSVDLTIIPFNGVVSPLVFGGVAKRDYFNRFDYLGSRITSRQTLFPIPNYGFGLVIKLGMGAHLRITQTYSPGVKTSLENGEEINRFVKDSYTQVWLGYRL